MPLHASSVTRTAERGFAIVVLGVRPSASWATLWKRLEGPLAAVATMAMPEPERHIRHNRHAGPRLGRGALDGRAPFAPPELEISISGLGIALLPHTR
jgi:hypothetical protein